MVLCFLLGKGRNTQYFLNTQEGDMSVYLSPVLESYPNQLETFENTNRVLKNVLPQNITIYISQTLEIVGKCIAMIAGFTRKLVLLVQGSCQTQLARQQSKAHQKVLKNFLDIPGSVVICITQVLWFFARQSKEHKAYNTQIGDIKMYLSPNQQDLIENSQEHFGTQKKML